MRRGQGREQVTASHGPARASHKWLHWGRPGEAGVVHVPTVVAPKGSCSPSRCHLWGWGGAAAPKEDALAAPCTPG